MKPEEEIEQAVKKMTELPSTKSIIVSGLIIGVKEALGSLFNKR